MTDDRQSPVQTNCRLEVPAVIYSFCLIRQWGAGRAVRAPQSPQSQSASHQGRVRGLLAPAVSLWTTAEVVSPGPTQCGDVMMWLQFVQYLQSLYLISHCPGQRPALTSRLTPGFIWLFLSHSAWSQPAGRHYQVSPLSPLCSHQDKGLLWFPP